MSDPLVVAVMLANGRPEMVDRAIRSFLEQSYKPRYLFIFATGPAPVFRAFSAGGRSALPDPGDACVKVLRDEKLAQMPIGTLRNLANNAAVGFREKADIFAHWDSDDWSHPNRLAEQVGLLKNSSAAVVGYRDCLFWDSRQTSSIADDGSLGEPGRVNEAWIYRAVNPSYAIGASLMYWRRTWEQKPFPALNAGEDTVWLMNQKVHAVPSTWWPSHTGPPPARGQVAPAYMPRMVCAIHGGNTTSRIQPGAKEWRRAAEYDEYCRKAMQL